MPKKTKHNSFKLYPTLKEADKKKVIQYCKELQDLLLSECSGVSVIIQRSEEFPTGETNGEKIVITNFVFTHVGVVS
jgi:hypothetical protein